MRMIVLLSVVALALAGCATSQGSHPLMICAPVGVDPQGNTVLGCMDAKDVQTSRGSVPSPVAPEKQL